MTNTERAIKLFTSADKRVAYKVKANGKEYHVSNVELVGGIAVVEYPSGLDEVITFGVDFKSGLTIITPDWETMKRYTMGGDVTMVHVRQSGEILYDTRDGWDIVTKSPSRVA